MTSIKFFLAPTAFTYTLSCCNQHWKFLFFTFFYRLGSIYVKSLKIFSIVRLLYCIYQWSPHHTDLSFICSYFWICPHKAWLWNKLNFIPSVLFTGYVGISIFFLVKLLPSLAENFIILRIFWDTNCKLYAFLHAGNVDFELIFPREVSLQWQVNLLFSHCNLRLISYKQIHIDSIFLTGINIFSQWRKRSWNIGRAACYSEPLLPYTFHMLFGGSLHTARWPYFQRIDIEKTLSIHCNTCKNRIVQSPFHHLYILCFFCNLHHAPRKKRQSDRCTGLTVIIIVRKIIIRSKAFQNPGWSDSSCHIHPSMHHIIP